ncbi:MAG: hypothetical protein KBD78_16325, partial [Oligoflexales bacterium]|nr:hypothetical protein [Oligoflexales bacterium]
YIYFDPTVGICFARSFYISLELAALKIATSAQYVLGEFYPLPENEWLSKVEKAADWEKKWVFHVTPLVVLNPTHLPIDEIVEPAPVMKGNAAILVQQLQEQENEPLIVDPSLFNEPVKRSHWFRALKSVGEAQLNILPGSNPFDTAPEQLDKLKNIKMPRNFSEMSKFTLHNIYYACRVIRFETSKKSSAKTLRLIQRTKELIELLSSPEFNKIDATEEVSEQEIRECMDTWGLN